MSSEDEWCVRALWRTVGLCRVHSLPAVFAGSGSSRLLTTLLRCRASKIMDGLCSYKVYSALRRDKQAQS